MRRPRPWVVVGLALLAAATGCSQDDPGSSAGEGDGTQVTMRLLAFKPEKLTVGLGTKVTWLQQDAGAHTVTSGVVEQQGGGVSQRPDGRFDSGEVAEGASFGFTFAEAGSYTYYCSLHPATMRGEVTVT